MKIFALGAAALGAALTPAAAAQTNAGLAPQTRTVVTPVAPPTTAVAEIAPGMFVVTPVPGLSTATKVRVQKFGDYDLTGDGVYNPMEFAQALYWLATSDPVAGNPTLPREDKYIKKGAAQTMMPKYATSLLNATSIEFMMVDMDKDGRISPQEMAASDLM